MNAYGKVLPCGVSGGYGGFVEEEGFSPARGHDSLSDVKVDNGIVSFDSERQELDRNFLLAGGRRLVRRWVRRSVLQLLLAFQPLILLGKRGKVWRKTPVRRLFIISLRAGDFAVSVDGRDLPIRPYLILEDLMIAFPRSLLSIQLCNIAGLRRLARGLVDGIRLQGLGIRIGCGQSFRIPGIVSQDDLPGA